MHDDLWVEKYRPVDLGSVVGNGAAVAALQAIAEESGDLPNMILAGPPGVGKTTVALCISRALLGRDDAVLELNSSHERGVDVVRRRIKQFIQNAESIPAERHKIVVLDEADGMTASAQNALSRMMDTHAASARFILTCNETPKIVEALRSRCAMVRFQAPSDGEVVARLAAVCSAENVPHDTGGLRALACVAEGDVRQALNCLESTYRRFEAVTAEGVYKVCDRPPGLRRLVETCIAGDFAAADKAATELWEAGYSPSDISYMLARVLRTVPGLGEAKRLDLLMHVEMFRARLTEGGGGRLQTMALIARLCATEEYIAQ